MVIDQQFVANRGWVHHDHLKGSSQWKDGWPGSPNREYTSEIIEAQQDAYRKLASRSS